METENAKRRRMLKEREALRRDIIEKFKLDEKHVFVEIADSERRFDGIPLLLGIEKGYACVHLADVEYEAFGPIRDWLTHERCPGWWVYLSLKRGIGFPPGSYCECGARFKRVDTDKGHEIHVTWRCPNPQCSASKHLMRRTVQKVPRYPRIPARCYAEFEEKLRKREEEQHQQKQETKAEDEKQKDTCPIPTGTRWRSRIACHTSTVKAADRVKYDVPPSGGWRLWFDESTQGLTIAKLLADYDPIDMTFEEAFELRSKLGVVLRTPDWLVPGQRWSHPEAAERLVFVVESDEDESSLLLSAKHKGGAPEIIPGVSLSWLLSNGWMYQGFRPLEEDRARKNNPIPQQSIWKFRPDDTVRVVKETCIVFGANETPDGQQSRIVFTDGDLQITLKELLRNYDPVSMDFEDVHELRTQLSIVIAPPTRTRVGDHWLASGGNIYVVVDEERDDGKARVKGPTGGVCMWKSIKVMAQHWTYLGHAFPKAEKDPCSPQPTSSGSSQDNKSASPTVGTREPLPKPAQLAVGQIWQYNDTEAVTIVEVKDDPTLRSLQSVRFSDGCGTWSSELLNSFDWHFLGYCAKDKETGTRTWPKPAHVRKEQIWRYEGCMPAFVTSVSTDLSGPKKDRAVVFDDGQCTRSSNLRYSRYWHFLGYCKQTIVQVGDKWWNGHMGKLMTVKKVNRGEKHGVVDFVGDTLFVPLTQVLADESWQLIYRADD